MKLLYNIKKVIFLIFVLYFLFYLSFDFVSPNLTVKYLGYKPYVVLTDSMEPAIKAGSLVIATYKKIDTLQKDDIIVVAPYNKLGIVHYLANKEISDGQLYLRTRRYNALSRKDWDYWRISDNQYIGYVSFVVPYVGNVFSFLRSVYGIIMIILLFVVNYVYRMIMKGINN